MEQKLIMTVEGQIKSCTTPKASTMYLKYGFYHGNGWSLAAGPSEGNTQNAKLDLNNEAIWNFPFTASFKAERPFGWPQIVVSVYGTNKFGNNVVVGYGCIHLPTFNGRHELEIPLFTPASTSLMQKLISKITGDSPTFSSPLSYLSGGDSREVAKTESQGFVRLTLNVLIGGAEGLDLGGPLA